VDGAGGRHHGGGGATHARMLPTGAIPAFAGMLSEGGARVGRRHAQTADATATPNRLTREV